MKKTENRPFICKPCGKDYLWGGRRLRDDLVKETEAERLAESWECSTHPDGPSEAADGEYRGMELTEVLRLHPEYLGSHVRGMGGLAAGQIPVLVKFIDAKHDLSVQVHPTDAYADRHENGQQGKTELWYIMDAAKDAGIVCGLRRKADKEQLCGAALSRDLEKYLRRIPVEKDQVFLVEAGTIHAVGAGCLIAEIQENSNLTYRLYDYDRVDKDGRKRELHLEKALDAADLTVGKELRQPLRVLRYEPGIARELLGRCRYFEVHRMLVNTERRQIVKFRADELSFRILLCIEGCGTLTFEDRTVDIYRGDCVFVPADSVDIRIHGKLQFLDVRC
ncbi:class I mannose-6-phosphate isomerase [bacterium 1XD8-76]|nr:class I mannose-6-phosphate isomerase [bacterium 1XD8-76]